MSLNLTRPGEFYEALYADHPELLHPNQVTGFSITGDIGSNRITVTLSTVLGLGGSVTYE